MIVANVCWRVKWFMCVLHVNSMPFSFCAAIVDASIKNKGIIAKMSEINGENMNTFAVTFQGSDKNGTFTKTEYVQADYPGEAEGNLLDIQGDCIIDAVIEIKEIIEMI